MIVPALFSPPAVIPADAGIQGGGVEGAGAGPACPFSFGCTSDDLCWCCLLPPLSFLRMQESRGRGEGGGPGAGLACPLPFGCTSDDLCWCGFLPPPSFLRTQESRGRGEGGGPGAGLACPFSFGCTSDDLGRCGFLPPPSFLRTQESSGRGEGVGQGSGPACPLPFGCTSDGCAVAVFVQSRCHVRPAIAARLLPYNPSPLGRGEGVRGAVLGGGRGASKEGDHCCVNPCN